MMTENNRHITVIGKYEIMDILGQGGMGIVYRARDVSNGRKVALKTVRVPDQSFIQSIRREIQALARIEHPGIIRILDEGLYEGMPWYAMEYLEATILNEYFKKLRDPIGTLSHDQYQAPGQDELTQELTVAEELPEWWTSSLNRIKEAIKANEPSEQNTEKEEAREGGSGPTAVSDQRDTGLLENPAHDTDGQFFRFIGQLIATMTDLCQALAYLHGNGIVHRDLKPHNIMVREDGSPVIVDFGLAAFLGKEASREVLGGLQRASGTLLYIAPEQFRSEQVDARADLYSLGCILYEIMLGRLPYSRGKIISRLATADEYHFPLPSRIDQRFPLAFDEVLRRLLVPDLHFRLGYAIDVVATLQEIKLQLPASAADEAERGKSRADYALPVRSYLYRPGFAGRAETLSALQHKIDNLVKGEGGFVVIGGESGVGKTRFAQEICRLAAIRDIQIVTGECFDGHNRPLEAMGHPLQWIADHCRSRGPEMCRRVIGYRARVIGLYEPAFMNLPGLEAVPEPIPLDADSSRYRLLSYFREILSSLIEGNPTVLLLDDLQWADVLTVQLLRHVHLSGIHREVPLLIMGTYRLEEMNEGLEELIKADGVDRIVLNCLEKEDVEQMIGDMLALYPPPAHFTNILHRHAEGNPFFIAEMLRSAIDANLLDRRASGSWFLNQRALEEAELEFFLQAEIPKSIYDLVARRLESVSPLEQAIIECGSIIGRQFNTTLLRTMFRDTDETVFLRAVKELLMKQILEEIKVDRLSFVHDKIREVVLRTMIGQRRRERYQLVAATIEHLPAEELEEHVYHLGDMWLIAENREKAKSWSLRGARAALGKLAMVEAERLYRATLELVSENSREGLELRLEMVKQPFFTLNEKTPWQKDFAILEEGAERLDDPELLAHIFLTFVPSYDHHGMPEVARDYLDKIEVLQKKADLSHLSRKIKYTRAAYFYARGNIKLALDILESAIEEFGPDADIKEKANYCALKALYLREQHDFSRAKQCFEEVIPIMTKEKMTRELAAVYMNYGGLLMYCDENEAALPWLQKAADMLSKAGSKFLEACSVHDLGLIFSSKHEFDVARSEITRALTIFKQMGDLWGQGGCLLSLSGVAIDMDQLETAQEHIEKSIDIFQQLGNALRLKYCYIVLSKIMRRSFQFDKAGEALERAASFAANNIENRSDAIELLIQRGHLIMALNGPIETLWNEYQQLLRTFQHKGPFEPSQSMIDFQQAVEAYQKSEMDRLHAGELISSLPPLRQHKLGYHE